MPDPPTDVAVTEEGNQTLKVVWTAPVGNGGANVYDYKIEYQEDGEQTWEHELNGTWKDTEHTLTGLTNGTQHTVRVRAINIAGESTESNTDTGTPRPDAGVTVSVKERSQTGATLTASIVDGNNEDHARFICDTVKTKPKPAWTRCARPKPALNGSADLR